MLYVWQLFSCPHDIHSEMVAAVLPEHCRDLNNTVQNSRSLTVGAQVHCEAVHVGFVVNELTIRWGFFQVLLYSSVTVISAVLGVILILCTVIVV